MEIYTFFTGGSVWNPIAWGAATKSLVEDNCYIFTIKG
jgi:hypothetical protein